MRKVSTIAVWIGAVAVVLAAPVLASADDAKAQGDPYPLATCPVSGEELGGMGDAVVKVYDGREVRFCCGGCVKKYEKDAAAYNEKIDDAIKTAEAGSYPLTTCIISGEALGDKPVVKVIDNRVVEFCCKGCVKKFEEDTAANMAKLDAAIVAAEKPVNDGGTCPISGKALGDAPVKKVYGNEVVAFCCGGCPAKFTKDYTENMEKLHKKS